MNYRLHDIPRVLALLAGTSSITEPGDRLCERIDAERAWGQMPDTPHRRMLWELCANDCTLTSAALRCGLYPARARAVLEEGAVLMLIRLNRRPRRY